MALPSNKPIYKISKDGRLFLIDQRTVIFGVDAFGLLTVVYKETECVAKGDSCCRLVGMTPSQWGMNAENEIRHYHELDVSAELVRAYGQLNEQHNLMAQSVSIHNSLINLISDGQELDGIVARLAELSQCEVACLHNYAEQRSVQPTGR